MFGFGNFSSYSGSSTNNTSTNKSSFNSEDDNRQNYQSRTTTTSKPKTKTYTNVNPTNDKVTTSTIKQSTLNKYKKKPKKKTPVVTFDGGGSDNNNTIAQVTKTAPTVAEVSQATTTKAAEDTEANRLLKIKKKGRSMMMMSGSQGVTKMAADYSLGKKSLLGRV